MRYGQIRHYDIANGPGIRTTLFVTGCSFNCPGCFNKEYQNPAYGDVFDAAAEQQLLDALAEPQVAGLTILGGEPFQNIEGLLPFVRKVRAALRPEQTIWIYSGYTYEQLQANAQAVELLGLCDVLVDGLFVEALKDLRLKFRGSSNQRLIDLKASRNGAIQVLD